MPRLGELNTRSTFIRRLAYFLIGTAIGLFMLQIFKDQRQRAVARQQAAESTAPTHEPSSSSK